MGKNLPNGMGLLNEGRRLWRFVLATLGDQLLSERERWPLWVPVGLGLGIGFYFSLPVEPPLWVGPSLAAALAVATVALRRHPPALLTLLPFLIMATGFAAAEFRTWSVAAPILERPTGPVRVSGQIAEIDILEKGQRVVLENVAIARFKGPLPQRVRVRLLRRTSLVYPGQWIAVTALLSPPPAPTYPGAYDFSRLAYFMRLGATGAAVGDTEILAPPHGLTDADQARMDFAEFRHRLTVHVVDVIAAEVDAPAGGVTATMITSEMDAIPDTLMSAYRDSGLAHILSISGLHISLVAGMIFVMLRSGLALVPAVALRFPVKKWAAALAIVATYGYLLLAGQPVPAIRSFLMAGVVLVAVLVDRTALSLRTLAWSAVVVMLWQPESMIGPSFQMSYGAVLSLIAAYEVIGGRLHASLSGGVLRWAWLTVAGMCLTTVLASVPTSVYAIYHFDRFSTFGMFANLIAIPLSGVWIMPGILLGMILYPFGLDRWAFVGTGWGVAFMNWLAEATARIPFAAVTVPPMPTWAMVLFTFGGLWLCLWRQKWRRWGLVAMLGALVPIAFATPPDILVDGPAKLIAVRGADGHLVVSKERGARMSRSTWSLRADDGAVADTFPEQGPSADGTLACDDLGCLYRAKGQVVALVKRIDALEEDCAEATVVVALVPARKFCHGPKLVVDFFDMWRNGAHALWLSPNGARVESVASTQGDRPWTRHPAKRQKPAEVDAED